MQIFTCTFPCILLLQDLIHLEDYFHCILSDSDPGFHSAYRLFSFWLRFSGSRKQKSTPCSVFFTSCPLLSSHHYLILSSVSSPTLLSILAPPPGDAKPEEEWGGVQHQQQHRAQTDRLFSTFSLFLSAWMMNGEGLSFQAITGRDLKHWSV